MGIVAQFEGIAQVPHPIPTIKLRLGVGVPNALQNVCDRDFSPIRDNAGKQVALIIFTLPFPGGMQRDGHDEVCGEGIEPGIRKGIRQPFSEEHGKPLFFGIFKTMNQFPGGASGFHDRDREFKMKRVPFAVRANRVIAGESMERMRTVFAAGFLDALNGVQTGRAKPFTGTHAGLTNRTMRRIQQVNRCFEAFTKRP